jgi:hypothetical protein
MRLLLVAVCACTIALASSHAFSADAPKGEGLTKAEATLAANRFFANEIAMEGAVAEPTKRGDYWVFPVKFGYANFVARDPILVHRFTGQVSWAGLDEHNARLGRSKSGPSK